MDFYYFFTFFITKMLFGFMTPSIDPLSIFPYESNPDFISNQTDTIENHFQYVFVSILEIFNRPYFYCLFICLCLIIEPGYWIQQDWILWEKSHTHALAPYKSIHWFKIVDKLRHEEDLLSRSSFTTGSWDLWLDSELSY